MSSPTFWLDADGRPLQLGDRIALAADAEQSGRIVDVARDHTGRPTVLLDSGGRMAIHPYMLRKRGA